MALQKSHLKMTGTLGDTTYYLDSNGQYRVRLLPKISKSSYANNPNYDYQRALLADRANVAVSASTIYRSVKPVASVLKGMTAFNALKSALAKLQKLDTVNSAGSKDVMKVLESADNRKLLEGLQFNPGAHMQQLIPDAYTPNIDNGEIIFDKIDTSKLMLKPLNVHKLGFNALWARIMVDEEGLDHSTYTIAEEVIIPLDGQEHQVKLETTGVPGATGYSIVILNAVYYRELNDKLFAVRDKDYTSACIAAIN